MPGSYQYLTKAGMRQALAARLDDPGMVYWVQPELDLYNAEALRTWQSLTRYWRDSFSFNTRPLTTPVNAFYDLTQQSNTLIPFTLKDTDLESLMCYNLIEKQPAAGVWKGTDQFTIYDLTNALQRRRDQFLVETGMVLTRTLVSGITPASNGSVALADSVIDLRRSAWLDGVSGQWSVVWKSDEFRAQALRFNWFTSPGIPAGASMAVQPPVTLQLLPPPLNPGELETITVNAGAALNPAVGVLLGIPDDFTWVIRFGALADLLGQDGQARDPARAAYCVPLDSEILTKNGWKKYDELVLGEAVLGYNMSTGLCEWTPLWGINVVKQQEVWTHQNHYFKVRCTKDHRWVIRRRGLRPIINGKRHRRVSKFRDNAELMALCDAPNDAGVVQAARAPDGPGLGNLSVNEYLHRGRGVEMVLKMTSGERRAFILGMMFGEGNVSGKGKGRVGASQFTQNGGPVYDAMRLACALEGIPTGRGHVAVPSRAKRFTLYSRQLRETRVKKRGVVSSIEDVWCPTTGLGTWVMRQGDVVTITGNCEQRWQEGIIAARAYTSVELAFINGSQVPVSSLFDLDTTQPGWQNSVGAQQVFALAGWNMLALSSPLNTNLALTTLFEDNFQRANEDPLSDGGKWATVPGTDTFRVLGSVCQESGFASHNYGTALYTGALPQDQFGRLTIGTVDDSVGTGLAFDIFVRSDPNNVNLYEFDVESPAAKITAAIYKVNGSNAETLVTLDPSIVAVPGDTWTLAAIGAGPVTLYIFRNGVLIATAIDNGTPILGGSAGPAMTGDLVSTAHATFTDWQCGGASAASSVTVDIVRNAPVPVADGDFVQLGREELDAVLGYAQHLASFKMGGAEFQATMKHLADFRRMALIRNERLAAAVRSAAQPLWDKGWREERQKTRREIELPQGISLDEVATRGG